MTYTIKIEVPKDDFLYLAKFIDPKSVNYKCWCIYFAHDKSAVATDGRVLAILNRAWWYDGCGQPWTAEDIPANETDEMLAGGVGIDLSDKVALPRIKNMPGDKLSITLCHDETEGNFAIIRGYDGSTIKLPVSVWDDGGPEGLGGKYLEYERVVPTEVPAASEGAEPVGLNPALLSRFAYDKKDFVQITTYGAGSPMLVKSAAYKERMTGVLMPVSKKCFE